MLFYQQSKWVIRQILYLEENQNFKRFNKLFRDTVNEIYQMSSYFYLSFFINSFKNPLLYQQWQLNASSFYVVLYETRLFFTFKSLRILSISYNKINTEMKITVELFGGKTCDVQVTEQTTIKELKTKIANQVEGLKYFGILHDNQSLEEDKTVGHYHLKDGHKVKLQMLMDIGVFGYHVNSPCHELLVESVHDYDRQKINGLIETLGGDQQAEFSSQDLDVSAKAKILVEYADKIYAQNKQANMPIEELDDLKITLKREQLVSLVGEELCERLENIFNEKPSEIIIRRGQSHGRMINFHTDVSLKTLQLSLNSDDEYEGGKLVYATQECLNQPKRNQGTVTVHDNKIVHGVTLFKSGVRYGLFFLCK